MLSDPFNKLGSDPRTKNFIKGIADTCFHSGLEHSSPMVVKLNYFYVQNTFKSIKLQNNQFYVQHLLFGTILLSSIAFGYN